MFNPLRNFDRGTTGLIGLVLSPFFAILLFDTINLVLGRETRPLSSQLETLIFSYFFIGMHVLLVAVPVFIIAMYFDYLSLFLCLIVGVTVGFTVATFSSHGEASWHTIISGFYSTGPIGAASAFFVWLIWRSGKNEF